MKQENSELLYALVREKETKTSTDIVIDGLEFNIVATHPQESIILQMGNRLCLQVVRILRTVDHSNIKGYSFSLDSVLVSET